MGPACADYFITAALLDASGERYSSRNALIGSARLARRAGRKLAKTTATIQTIVAQVRRANGDKRGKRAVARGEQLPIAGYRFSIECRERQSAIENRQFGARHSPLATVSFSCSARR
jgi:hypothetical protein